jgi:hypothetical protein
LLHPVDVSLDLLGRLIASLREFFNEKLDVLLSGF